MRLFLGRGNELFANTWPPSGASPYSRGGVAATYVPPYSGRGGVDLLMNSREHRHHMYSSVVTKWLMGNPVCYFNKDSIINTFVCFSRAKSKWSWRKAARDTSKHQTVIGAIISFPRGSHIRAKLNTRGSHGYICKHAWSINTVDVSGKSWRNVSLFTLVTQNVLTYMRFSEEKQSSLVKCGSNLNSTE